jgi:hypothetical protein
VTEEFADAGPEGFDGSFGSLPQERLQFRKGHLDRVQVGRVARQETQFGALDLDRFPDFRPLVRGEIVDQDDVARRKRRNELVKNSAKIGARASISASVRSCQSAARAIDS